MVRTTAYLMAVLAHVAPSFQPRAEAAAVLSSLGKRYGIDPLLLVADAEHESRWQAWVINPSSGTTGLMQILPVGEQSTERLLDWRHNLSVGAADFAAARSYCVAHHRGALARNWLQLPTGWDKVRGSRCGYRAGKQLPIPKQVIALLARRAELERMFKTERRTDGQGSVSFQKRRSHGGADHDGRRQAAR